MLGYRAGGIAGLDKGKKMCFDSVNVEDNVILAVRADTDYSCAGGVCGKKEAFTTENNLNHMTVKNNHIFSSNNNAAYQSAGGIFGYLDFQEETAEVYSYQALAEDNDIGYYDMTGNIPATGTLLTDAAMTGQMQKVKEFGRRLQRERAGILPDAGDKRIDSRNKAGSGRGNSRFRNGRK